MFVVEAGCRKKCCNNKLNGSLFNSTKFQQEIRIRIRMPPTQYFNSRIIHLVSFDRHGMSINCCTRHATLALDRGERDVPFHIHDSGSRIPRAMPSRMCGQHLQSTPLSQTIHYCAVLCAYARLPSRDHILRELRKCYKINARLSILLYEGTVQYMQQADANLKICTSRDRRAAGFGWS